MVAIQLHDKDEEIIGTILVTTKNTQDDIVKAWDEFLIDNEYPDIWGFVNEFPKMDMEVITIDFYQPK